MTDNFALRVALLATLLLGLAAVPAEAGRREPGDGWRGFRSVRLRQSEGCRAKHPDGWGSAPRGRHGRH